MLFVKKTNVQEFLEKYRKSINHSRCTIIKTSSSYRGWWIYMYMHHNIHSAEWQWIWS